MLFFAAFNLLKRVWFFGWCHLILRCVLREKRKMYDLFGQENKDHDLSCSFCCPSRVSEQDGQWNPWPQIDLLIHRTGEPSFFNGTSPCMHTHKHMHSDLDPIGMEILISPVWALSLYLSHTHTHTTVPLHWSYIALLIYHSQNFEPYAIKLNKVIRPYSIMLIWLTSTFFFPLIS